jgi:hypothetical protein
MFSSRKQSNKYLQNILVAPSWVCGPPTLLISLTLTMVVHAKDGGLKTSYDEPMHKQNSKFLFNAPTYLVALPQLACMYLENITCTNWPP